MADPKTEKKEVSPAGTYVLSGPYFDGRKLHPRGAKMNFKEGEGPKAKVKAEEAKEKVADVPATTAAKDKKK